MKIFPTFVSAMLILSIVPAVAQQMVLAPGKSDCGDDEPDTVEVSWNTPCDQGSWLYEPGVGCRMWDWHPDKDDTSSWSGSCRGSLKEGPGSIQWTEHGQPIDRFEGTFVNGHREGPGTYTWSRRDRFDGLYARDLPNGLGTVTIDGIRLSGEWRNGCLRMGDRTVAIGVSLTSCAGEPDYTTQTAELPDQEMLK